MLSPSPYFAPPMPFCRVDVLVISAGRIDAADAVRFSVIDPDAWGTLFRVDAKGTLLMCQAVIPHMKKRGGGARIQNDGVWP